MKCFRMLVPVGPETTIELVITTTQEEFNATDVSIALERLMEFVEIMKRNLER